MLDAAAELGYQVDNRARLLRSSRTKLVGVVFRVQDAFHAELVEALYKAAANSDYDVVLSGTTEERSELTAVESLLNDRCEALVLVSPQMSEAELGALGERAPTIVLARRVRSQAVDVVMTADLEVVRTALDHLVSLGHRDIAHLGGGSIHGATDRRRSYRTLMRRSGSRSTSGPIPAGTPKPTGCVPPSWSPPRRTHRPLSSRSTTARRSV